MAQRTNQQPLIEALIMLGGMGQNPAEALMQKALEAAAYDLAQICQQSGEFAEITVVADSNINTPDDEAISLQLSRPHATFGNLINQFSKSISQKTTLGIAISQLRVNT